MDAFYHPLGKLFGFLSTYKLIEPHKTNVKNYNEIVKTLKEFLAKSTDKKSVYQQLLNSGKLTKEEVFYDTMLLLFAGFDTTSHSIVSTLYYMHKHPACLEKLKTIMKSQGITDLDPSQGSKLKTLYEE